MIETLRTTTHFYHYANYCMSTMLSGLFAVSIGSIIPYLSEESGRAETQYSTLVACKGYGMLIGAFLSNYIHKQQFCPTNHQILMSADLIIAVNAFLFFYSSTQFFQSLWIFIAQIGLMVLDVQINIATLNLSDSTNLNFWMQIIWAMFSFGAIIAPILVYQLGKNMIFLIVLLGLANFVFYIFLKSPQSKIGSINDTQNLKITLNQPQTSQTYKKQISNNCYYWLCALRFLFIGFLFTLVMWTPSYAVLTNITDKQGANIFPTIFWTIDTFFMFVVAAITWKTSQKLIYPLISSTVTLIISSILVAFGYTLYAVYFYCIFLSIFTSPVYASIFTVCNEYGYRLSGQQVSGLSLWGSVGQAVLEPIAGVVMQIIHIHMFLIFMLISLIFMLISIFFILQELKTNTQQQVNITELQSMKEVKKESKQKVHKLNSN